MEESRGIFRRGKSNSSPQRAAKNPFSLSVRDMFDESGSTIEYNLVKKVDLAQQEGVKTSIHMSSYDGTWLIRATELSSGLSFAFTDVGSPM